MKRQIRINWKKIWEMFDEKLETYNLRYNYPSWRLQKKYIEELIENEIKQA